MKNKEPNNLKGVINFSDPMMIPIRAGGNGIISGIDIEKPKSLLKMEERLKEKYPNGFFYDSMKQALSDHSDEDTFHWEEPEFINDVREDAKIIKEEVSYNSTDGDRIQTWLQMPATTNECIAFDQDGIYDIEAPIKNGSIILPHVENKSWTVLETTFGLNTVKVKAELKSVINQHRNIMNQEEFKKIAKKAKSAKELVSLYLKNDYAEQIKTKESEIKKLNKELEFYQSLNAVTRREQMHIENKLDEKRINQVNNVIKKEMIRLVAIRDGLGNKIIPVFERDTCNIRATLIDKIHFELNELEKCKQDFSSWDDVDRFMEQRISKIETLIYRCKTDIMEFNRNSSIDSHVIEVLKGHYNGWRIIRPKKTCRKS